MTLKDHKEIGNILNAYLDTLIDDADHFDRLADRFSLVDPSWARNMRLWNQAYEFIIGAITSHMRAYDFDLTSEVHSDYE